jgi:hypothetical protein
MNQRKSTKSIPHTLRMSKNIGLGLCVALNVAALALAFSQFAVAQKIAAEPASVLLVEDFTYTPGSLLTNNGWTAHSAGGTNAIVTSAPSLSLAGYPGSGVGNAVSLTTSGEDDNRTFAVQSTGSVYAAFLVNISDASTDPAGGYFFHLGPDPVGTTFRGRVFVKKDASNNIAFGISKSLTASTDIVFTPFSYSLNTTYLVVVKYAIVDGATNDTVSLFVSTNVPASEPAPTVIASDTTQTDISPGTVSLRQGAAATSPTLRVDGIRVGTSWADVTQGPTVNTQHVSDYNGDGKTDYAVVRNVGGGVGGQVRWFINLNGTSTMAVADWGVSTDFFTPEDFDGDNKTDVSIWRPGITDSLFYIFQSGTNTVRIVQFGLPDDDPSVVGDYDGDGKADLAVYRSGTLASPQSVWYFLGSNNNPSSNITYVQWGQNGDFPTVGDFDGDGKNDFVIQRNDGGGARFWMFQTTAGIETLRYGSSSDNIVPGDYDGDGKTDLAVARSVGGQWNWFYRPSSTGAISAAPAAVWGSTANDFLIPGDYDGDGKSDFAVWRATTNPAQFWVLGTTSGPSVVSFGLPGDYPPANTPVN